MAFDPSTRDVSLESKRPIQFRYTSDEVAVGALMGCSIGSFGTLIGGGLVGALGATIGNRFGYPVLLGGLFVWLAFWVLPLMVLMRMKPWWRFLAAIALGATCLALFQWHIQQRDIGAFYPWILSALPFGIVLGTFSEPIRLAQGGSTEEYDDRGLIIAGGFVIYGNRNAIFLTAGYVLGFVADIVSLGRRRIGAAVAGTLGGGLPALGVSALVAWRGDDSVADLFFGNKWNIAWAGAALGAVTGAVSGYCAALLRERQHVQHQQLFQQDQPLVPQTTSDNIKEA